MGAAVIAAVFFTVFFGAAKITDSKELVKRADYKGIITVWQIDTFEGGTGSRRQFLSNRAKEFSKNNQGVLFMITTHTKESAEENFRQGIFPDLLSFGGGVLVSSAAELSANLFFKGGAIGGNVYATPWCRGGYALIKHRKFSELSAEKEKKISSLIVSQSDYTMPLMAAFCGGYEIEKYEIYSPVQAYNNFLLGKVPYLLGTQRDIARLKARGENFTYTPVEGFCDLYQYVAITGENALKAETAAKFIDYLLSGKCQGALDGIFMLPVKSGVKVEEEIEPLYNAEIFSTVSVFLSGAEISGVNENLYEYYKGNTSLYTKIKNVVI